MLVRRSSSIGKMVVHLCFKTKYCHRIFVHKQVEERCKEIFFQTAQELKLTIYEIGFDENHVHMVIDIGLMSVTQVAKVFKGRSAKFLLREFRFLKKQYFWGSGLWNPALYFDSLGSDIGSIREYVRTQGY